jgi:hypothetical protein
MRCEIDSASSGVCRCAGGEEGGFGVALHESEISSYWNGVNMHVPKRTIERTLTLATSRGILMTAMTYAPSAERVFFSDAGFYVSSTRLIASGTTYDMRAILSVRVGPPPPSPIAVNLAVGLFALAGVYAAATYVFVASDSCGNAYTGQNGALIVAALVFVGVLLVAQQRSVTRGRRAVFVGTTGGEVMLVAATNLPWADAFAAAIEAALSAR